MLEYQFPHYFTVEEANGLLPTLTEMLLHLHTLVERAREEYEADADQVLKLILQNGHKEPPVRSSLIDQIHQLIQDVHRHGVILKDVDVGLVDFPHLREGHEVFLCWRLGEPAVEHWHELETGYAGRQPL